MVSSGPALRSIQHEVTYAEFDAFKQWLISVSDTGEWPLFVDVYLEHEVEKVAAKTQQGSIGTILGPFWLDGQAQLKSPATLPMRDDEPGAPMILAGQVTATDGTPLTGAKVDIWQTDDEGWYSGFASKPPAGNLRGVVICDDQGRFEIHTAGVQIYFCDPHPQAHALHDPARRRLAHRDTKGMDVSRHRLSARTPKRDLSVLALASGVLPDESPSAVSSHRRAR
jgi:protocatechuate 3,4-dioxygenase beta subunit